MGKLRQVERGISLNTGHRWKYTKKFDTQCAYDGHDLGSCYTREGTTFRLWSPQASAVTLRCYDCGDVGTPVVGTCPMHLGERGVWSCTIPGDLHGIYYDYELRYGEECVESADPYAVSCGCNGIRSMVVDLQRTNPEGFTEDVAPPLQDEQIIYELHIKDFSHDVGSGIPQSYRGKYKAFTVEHPDAPYPTGVAYLKELGVTHVHLLPFYDFASVDEAGDGAQFNWGYDPLNYNVPEGSYATDAHDGCVRIRECKEMIAALHKAGIRVVMDVVYNHTFTADSWLERTAPGYFCRRTKDGALANGSACGNDMAVGREMVDNYIADSVMYWAKEYHIDGFRFDLMGLLTVELMNRIRREMDAEFGPGEILLYGEPWRAAPSPMEQGTKAALKRNVQALDDGVAIFSDDIRDVIKGHVFYAQERGFVNGGKRRERKVLQAASAFCKTQLRTTPKSPSQIISYVSAHDNFTLWDKLVFTMRSRKQLYFQEAGGGEALCTQVFTQKDADLLAANKLAALMYFTFQGHIFFQAGEEFGRTKLGEENSYNASAQLNMLRWEQTQTYADLVSYYKGLIALRKSLPGLWDKTPQAKRRISQETIHGPGVVSFLVDNRNTTKASPYAALFILYNASKKAYQTTLAAGEWVILANGEQAGCCLPCPREDNGTISVPACSGIVVGLKENT